MACSALSESFKSSWVKIGACAALLGIIVFINDALVAVNNKPLGYHEFVVSNEDFIRSIINGTLNASEIEVPSSTKPTEEPSCEDLLLSAWQQSCREAARGNNTIVQLCNPEGVTARGYVVLQQEPPVLQAGLPTHPVYRVRFVGAEILTPDIHYCGEEAVLQYDVAHEGFYHVEVLLLYSNFNYSHPPQQNYDIYETDFGFYVRSADVVPTISQMQHINTLPKCSSSSIMAGKWVARELFPSLFTTCQIDMIKGYVCSHPHAKRAHQLTVWSTDVNNTDLQWQPHECQYEEPSASLLAQVVSNINKRICMVGDSQTRHLHNCVAEILDQIMHNHHMSISANSSNGTTIKAIASSDMITFVEELWGNKSLDFAECSHVFYNFGQWPISQRVERPWSPMQYGQQLEVAAKHLVQQQIKYQFPMFWVTTNQHPIIWSDRQVDNKDWRTDPMFLLYNKIANSVMHSYMVPVLDTYAIARPLQDLSYDNAHYLGIICKWQARLIMTALLESRIV